MNKIDRIPEIGDFIKRVYDDRFVIGIITKVISEVQYLASPMRIRYDIKILYDTSNYYKVGNTDIFITYIPDSYPYDYFITEEEIVLEML